MQQLQGGRQPAPQHYLLLYLLPPYGPLPKLDMVVMSVLSQHAPLLPVIAVPGDAASIESAAFQASVAAMLADLSLAGIDKLPPVKLVRFECVSVRTWRKGVHSFMTRHHVADSTQLLRRPHSAAAAEP